MLKREEKQDWMNSKNFKGRKDVENKKKGGETEKMEKVVMGITVQILMGRLITTLPCLTRSPCGNRTCFIH